MNKWVTIAGALLAAGGVASVALGWYDAIGGGGLVLGVIALLYGVFGEKDDARPDPLPLPDEFKTDRKKNRDELRDRLDNNETKAREEAENASMDDVVDGVNDFLGNAPGPGPERPED